MKCGNCEADIVGSESACHSCGKTVASGQWKSQPKGLSYAQRRHIKNPTATFRAKKLGFKIQSDVPPVPPPHTASAARPAPFLARKRTARPSPAAAITALLEKPAAIAARLQQSLEAKKHVAATLAPPLKKQPLPQTQRMKVPEIPAPARLPVRPGRRTAAAHQKTSSHFGTAAGILVFTLTLGLGVSWWVNNNYGANQPTADTLATSTPVINNKLARRINDERTSSANAALPSGAISVSGSSAVAEDESIALNSSAKISSSPDSAASSEAAVNPDSGREAEKLLQSEAAERSAKDEEDTAASGIQDKEQPDRGSASEKQKKASASIKKRADKSSGKTTAAAKKERLKEIDRVRTQAYSETKKDRLNGARNQGTGNSYAPQSSKKKNPRNAAQLAKSRNTQTAYARCESRSNLIERERCKWQLCSSSWGKNGCPSFARNETFVY